MSEDKQLNSLESQDLFEWVRLNIYLSYSLV
ncbi:hypothetical protein JOC74_001961 [Bacillus capparidis]|uniref:Uncharacterized protein n=1 Tax=Bacillus capparidis TaxID=1840411 RepID=A0ABS4CV64_9BACI|nr:hypothetical protein [Bacillus capparidis]